VNEREFGQTCESFGFHLTLEQVQGIKIYVFTARLSESNLLSIDTFEKGQRDAHGKLSLEWFINQICDE